MPSRRGPRRRSSSTPQLVDYGVTTEETETRARALIDQWGVGRRGFDDGLAIFFDIDPSLEHGQVQLYAAPGFEATFLTNANARRSSTTTWCRTCGTPTSMGRSASRSRRIDAAATPENAARLEAGRQINAVLGLIGAPVAFMGLAGWAYMQWRRFGKDPVYLDDPSILMPAPPPDLTAASGAFVMDGGTSRRALTTAMLDLASRGLISFREDRGLLGLSNKVGIDVGPPTLDPVEEARRALNARRPIGPAEEYALKELPDLAAGKDDGYIEAERPAEVRHVRLDVRLQARVARREQGLDGREAEQGRQLAGPARACWRSWPVASPLFAGINVPIVGSRDDRRRHDRGRHRRSSGSRVGCRR